MINNTIISKEEVERLVEKSKDKNNRLHRFVTTHKEMLEDGIERGIICQKKVDYYKDITNKS